MSRRWLRRATVLGRARARRLTPGFPTPAALVASREGAAAVRENSAVVDGVARLHFEVAKDPPGQLYSQAASPLFASPVETTVDDALGAVDAASHHLSAALPPPRGEKCP